ncbi:Acetyltransferase, GNAT family [Clostridium bornimense]|uniref:Acetyltransferase, GNAT family n=1 Tax=Clostridium bornimense TaxID=1216932 RepID=W6RXM2_9CLOT|nr:GNAT family N-acetyltransferase [Clostridium bornimense]CDM68379.1 Acetyltransferase, GNAT family [Clostridium bornimense]
MYVLERINKKNFKYLKDLNLRSKGLNNLNEDILIEIKRDRFLKKFKLLSKLRIISFKGKYVGFIWFERSKYEYSVYNIKSIYAEGDNLVNVYNKLLSIIPDSYSGIYYSSIDNCIYNNVLEALKFRRLSGACEMKMDLCKITTKCESVDNLAFKMFKCNRDEDLRCRLQNIIFYNSNRIPLTVDDIKYDLTQKYSIRNGGVFLYYENEPIGYGQIIYDKRRYYIVNFGIIPAYRGKGYSKNLLYKLCSLAQKFNADELYLKVDVNNKVAIDLYKKFGFEIVEKYYRWIKVG